MISGNYVVSAIAKMAIVSTKDTFMYRFSSGIALNTCLA